MKNNSPVYVLRCESYNKVVKELTPALMELLPSLRGKKVLIKPNILSPLPQERGVTTHPEVCRVVIECVLKKGGTPIIGDSPGVSGYGATERAAEVSGIKGVAGDFFINFSRNPKKVRIRSNLLNSVSVASPVLETDYIVNVPKFKTHSLTGFTGGMKNMFGIVVGGEKAKVHRLAPSPESFAEAMVDIYSLRPPELTIVDGIMGMEGNGPSAGDVRKVGYILISQNAVNLDTLMAGIMNVDPHNFPILRISKDRRLGEVDLDKIKVEGHWEPIRDFKLPYSYRVYKVRSMSYFINRFVFPSFTSQKLVLIKNRCKQCRVCVEECPQGAIKMKDDRYPEIDRKVCINCYCCMELCPEHAWEFGGIINKLRRWL